MTTINREIVVRSNSDSDDVYYTDENGAKTGFGIKPKKGDNIIYILKCPNCRRENYAMLVSSGKCCWCSWDANI